VLKVFKIGVSIRHINYTDPELKSDPSVFGLQDPDLSVNKQKKSRKTLISTV
jgi:hypothetical protein